MKAKFQQIVAAIAVAIAIAGCSGGTSPGSLVGTYAVQENGKLNEFIRIERSGDEYLMFEKQSGRWLNPVKVAPVDKAKLEAMLKESVSVSFVGLGNDMVALFKMPVGWRSGNFETKTGYWLATVLGPVDLHKQ